MENKAPGTAKQIASISRRKALVRLGLAAGAIYVAPTVTDLNRAKADQPPWAHGSGCENHGHGHGHCDD